MAQNRVTIDVEARFVDNVTRGANNASRAVNDTTRSVRQLNNQRANPRIGADTQQAEQRTSKVQKLLRSLNNTKVKAVLDATDNASKKINKITDLAKSLTKKTWSAVVKITDAATSPLKKIKDSLFSIKGVVTAIIATIAANKTILQPISLADQYSKAKIGFSTLLGAEAGQQMMDDLDEFARITPFKTSEVIASAQKMLAMGWNAEDIISDMGTIGDAAAATGKGEEGLNRIVLALSQIKSKGKLSTEELNQLAEAGIAAKRYIAEGLGYGSGDSGLMAMTKDLENGAIGAEAGINAIIEGMKEYNGMMQTTANETVEGLKSQLEDTFEINIYRRWGQGLQDGAKKGLGSVIELLDEAEGALAAVGDMLYEVGKTASNYLAGALENTVKRIKDITSTAEFQNASLGEKIKMIWTGALKNPFKEWWQNTVVPWWEHEAKPWFVEKAAGLGTAIGTGLSNGLLALLGVDIVGAAEDGASIGASFFKGFADGFDASAVTKALVDAIANVWSALPAWAQLLVGGSIGGKVASGIGGLASLGGRAFGMLGSASAGTGLMGAGANAAIALGAGNLAGGASLGAGSLAGLGLAGVAGGVAAGASAISGIVDAYKAIKDDSLTAEQKDAYGRSAGAKIGGVAAGGAIGAAIGSVVPVIGTAIGGLIGAGVGGLVGWLGGNKIKKDALESMTSAELAAQESEEAYKELQRRQELVAQAMSENFGSIKLTAQEISDIVANVVIGEKAEEMEKFSDAASTAKTAMSDVSNSAGKLNRWNWKASLGFNFDDTTKQSYLSAVEEFITNAESAVEAKHYEFTAAVDMLLEPDNEAKDGITAGIDSYFATVQTQLDSATNELNAQVKVALEDGVIDVDEAAVLADLQNQVAAITNKLAEAQSDAEWQALQIKFSSANIDPESFAAIQEEIKTKLEASQATYDEALTAGITSLNLQLSDGAIDQATYDSQMQTLMDGYTANVDGLKAKATDLQLEIGADAFKVDKEVLSDALSSTLAEGVDPANWTQEQAETYLGMTDLEEKTRLGIGNMLSTVADTLPAESTADARNSIAEALKPSEANVATMRTQIDSALQQAMTGGFDVTASVRINTLPTVAGQGNKARGGLVGANIPGYSNGGMVSGGAQLITVAEEGSPEMIIPLSSQRRSRGLKLWEKAGQMMGIPGFANGGLVGNDEGLRNQQYGGGEATGGPQGVQVDVGGVTVEIQVNGGETGNMAEAIKAQGTEIAETVAGILADAFNAQFANTPARG